MLANPLIPTFILLVGALVVAGAFFTTQNPNAELQRRVQKVTGVSAPQKVDKDAARIVNDDIAKGERLNKRVRSFFAVGARYNWAMQSGWGKLVTVAVVMGLAVWGFAHHMVGISAWISGIAAVFATFFVPRLLLLREQRKAETKFMDLFPDAVDTIVRMLRAGLPMSSAVRVVGMEGTPPVSKIFMILSDQIKIGIPLEEALDSTSQQIGLSDFRFFAVTVLLQYSTGGNIAATLEVLATVIRKRRQMRLKASSATAEIRLTAYVLGALPFLTMGILLIMQPGYLSPLFNDPRGHVILGIAASGLMASFLTMRFMLRSVTKM
ncbi:MAG: type II secretion system F family protein [Alphaproteobacteria bacterium]